MVILTESITIVLISTLTISHISGLVVEEDWSSTGWTNQWSICSWGHKCVPLNFCTVVKQLTETGCLTSNRAKGLVCGYRGGEPMVCCPESCPWSSSSTSSNVAICGSRPVFSSSQLAFPWTVRVSFTNKETGDNAELCVGSIISRRVVLTAAHCALAKTKSHKISAVVVGSNSGGECCKTGGIRAKLSHVVLHPAYRPQSFSHNIALLVLKQPLNYTRSVSPICLPAKNESMLYPGQRSLLVGWGRLSSANYDTDGVERQDMADLPLLPRNRCVQVYGSKVKITEDMVCAGGEGTEPCSGFGGAPLVVMHPTRPDRYYQVGLLSFGGDKCGTIGVPSVYTRVESYLDWIQSNSPQDSIL